jgi:hypothetical protein
MFITMFTPTYTHTRYIHIHTPIVTPKTSKPPINTPVYAPLYDRYLGDPTAFKLDNTTDSNTSDTQIQWQKRWEAPREIQLPYIVAPSDDGGLDAGTDAEAGEKAEEKRHMLTVNWLVNDAPLTPVERLELVVLDELLLGTTAAPLRDAMTR